MVHGKGETHWPMVRLSGRALKPPRSFDFALRTSITTPEKCLRHLSLAVYKPLALLTWVKPAATSNKPCVATFHYCARGPTCKVGSPVAIVTCSSTS
eukprot:2078094-Amphidinium_carterae.1